MPLGREFRLPTDARPTRYRVRIDLDLDSSTFRGDVSIDVALSRPRRELVLHARELALTGVVARSAHGESVPHVTTDDPAQAVVLTFAEELPAGAITLAAGFSGRIRDDLKALYRSTRGSDHYVVALLFPSETRRLFPCFDEPTFKARFALELTGPADLTAVANARLVEKAALESGRARWRFAETPPLSTYLLMFAVGPFEGTEVAATRGGVPTRVWLPRGLGQHGVYARDAHRRAVDWLEDYTGIAYPYDKVEGLGIPDFPAGAMENPGAITYRLDLLSIDPARTAARRQKACVSVVSHELTHMWWGDLATLAWWDDIWLNEAFATFVGHKAEDAVHPEWQVWRDFVVGSAAGFALDALVSTHAIHSAAATAEESLQRFDAISYQKGAAVLRMIEAYLGADAFRAGVRIYLDRYREANASASDFWRALDEASRQDVTAIARSWILEPGHPLVDLALASETRIEMTQRRFFLDADVPATTQRWAVPLTLRTPRGTLRAMLDGARGATEIPAGAWVHPNAGATGFYRFRMDRPLRERLLANVAALDATERLILVDNEWALLRAGLSTVAAYLAVLDVLADEADRVVLGVIGDQLRWIGTHASTGVPLSIIASRARTVFGPHLARLGWDERPGERDDDRDIRAMAVSSLGELADDRMVQADARARVEAHLRGEPQPPDLIGACLAAAAAAGDDALAARYLDRLRDPKADPQEHRRVLTALPLFREPRASARVIDAVFDGTFRDQDLPGVFHGAFRNASAREGYWRAFRDRFAERIAPLEGLVKQACISAVGHLTPRELAPEADAFLAALDDPDMREVVARTRETLRLGVRSARAIAHELSVTS